MEVIIFVWSVLIILISCFVLKIRKRIGLSQQSPGHIFQQLPGHKGLWWLGNLYGHNTDALHLVVEQWAERFGRIFVGNLFGTTFVFLNDFELIKTAFTSDKYEDCFNDRAPTFGANYIMENSDIAFARFSKELINLRQVFHRALGTYGDGVQRFENIIQAEIKNSIGKLAETRTKNMDLKTYFKHSLSNVVSVLLSGEPFADDDSDIEMFWEYDKWFPKLLHPSIETFLKLFPFLRFLPGKYGATFRETRRTRDILLNKYYYKMKQTYCPGEIRGMVDAFFAIKEKQEAEGKTWFTENHIKGLIQDVTVAGLATSFLALTGLFLVLLERQDIQASIQSEIDSVVGTHRPVTIQDRPSMPYTQATILEILRYMSHVPLAAPHYCSKDAVLEGYMIKKGSFVVPYLWGIHHNKDRWEDPWEVKPERFLDEDGNLLPPKHPRRQALLPFGVGRRQCPGESFGKSRIFLYTTNLLQRFNFLPPDGVALPSPDPRNYELGGLSIAPPDYVCKLEQRL